MNELDWWIASQWEMFKIKEGKTGLEFNKTDKEGKHGNCSAWRGCAYYLFPAERCDFAGYGIFD